MESVVVAFENEALAKKVKDLLEGDGVAKCLLCQSGDQARRTMTTKQIHCVVSAYRLRDGLGEWLYDDLPPACSMVMIGARHQLDLCENPEILKLPTPIGKSEVLLAVRMAIQFGGRLERALKSRRSSAEEEEITRAKALLMQRDSLTEGEAHRVLQRRSMDGGLRLIQAARLVLHEGGG